MDFTEDAISQLPALHLLQNLGIEERNKATVSRYIREAVEAGMI